MRSKIDAQKAWEGSTIASQLIFRCSCGSVKNAIGDDVELEALRREMSVAGWRFNDAGNRCLCPKCGPKKYPELYSASQRNPPRVVRRLGQKTR